MIPAALGIAGETTNWTRIGDISTVVTAVLGAVIAALVAYMPYVRRPRLLLRDDEDRTQSAVEETPYGEIPYVRILAGNKRGRRAAQGTRVMVEGYRSLSEDGAPMKTLGHPSLGWPSAPEANETASVTVFAGGYRPIGLGRLVRARLDPSGDLARPAPAPDLVGRPWPHFEENPGGSSPGGWYLWLDLAFGQDLNDDRDKLPPTTDGYAIRLVIGADDGPARSYDVHIRWDGDPDRSADEVMASALEHLAVIES